MSHDPDNKGVPRYLDGSTALRSCGIGLKARPFAPSVTALTGNVDDRDGGASPLQSRLRIRHPAAVRVFNALP
jgi:hypothetical protein